MIGVVSEPTISGQDDGRPVYQRLLATVPVRVSTHGGQRFVRARTKMHSCSQFKYHRPLDAEVVPDAGPAGASDKATH